jgi:hydroxypyruvate isomerase
MLQASVCIETLFTEVDLYHRPARVAEAGLGAVEFWGTEQKDLDRLRDACDDAGVDIAAFVGLGSRQLVAQQDANDMMAELETRCEIADEFGCDTLIVTVGNLDQRLSLKEQAENVITNLRICSRPAEEHDLRLAVEPLNTLVDHAGYFLDHTADAVDIVRQVDSPAVGLLHDIYHMQIMEGNLIQTIRENVEYFHHVHIADVPGRNEPGTGEINYANVMRALADAGYDGYCGFEFRPTDASEAAVQQALEACGLG